MRYFGIHLGHDTGIAVFNQFGELDFFAQSERYFPRQKNYSHDINPIEKLFGAVRPQQGDIVTITATGENDLYICDFYDTRYMRFGKNSKNFFDKEIVPNFVIDHHFAHVVSSWCFREDDKERLFLSYDGSGPDCLGNWKSSMVGLLSKDGFAIIDDAFPILSSSALSDVLGFSSAGKTMGLSGCFSKQFGSNEDLRKLIEFSYNKHNLNINPQIPSPWSNENLEWAASFYKFITNQMWEDVDKNIKKYSNGRGVIIGGGSSLCLEINTKIYNTTKDVVFGPAANDSGLALGAAAFSFWHINKKWPIVKTVSINEIQEPLPRIGPQNPKGIAKLLATNRPIGLLRGKAECGPRALCFRSILCPADKPENLHFVSEVLKERENFRPLAPVVLDEDFNRYFIGPRGKYMQYRVECTDEAKKEIPAVVHRDNSARPQVVYQNDPWLYDLLLEYKKISGHGCLINTSLNAKNMPICNTYNDALNDFKNKKITLISIESPSWEIKNNNFYIKII